MFCSGTFATPSISAEEKAKVMNQIKNNPQKDLKKKPKEKQDGFVDTIVRYLDAVKSDAEKSPNLPINWMDISDDLGMLYFCRTGEHEDLKLWRADDRQNVSVILSNSEVGSTKIRWRRDQKSVEWPIEEFPIIADQLYIIQYGQEVIYVEFKTLPEDHQDSLIDSFLLMDENQCIQQTRRLLDHQILK